jgi:hypothetical protein
MGTIGSFPESKAVGGWSWPLFPISVEARNAWSYTATSQYVFLACCLVKHKNNFTFTFTFVNVGFWDILMRDLRFSLRWRIDVWFVTPCSVVLVYQRFRGPCMDNTTWRLTTQKNATLIRDFLFCYVFPSEFEFLPPPPQSKCSSYRHKWLFYEDKWFI